MAAGVDVVVESPTVGEVLDVYFAGADLAPASRSKDRAALDHVPDAFRARLAGEVKPVHVGTLWASMAADGVSSWAVARLAGVMSKAWAAAAPLGWVDSNPFRSVPAPKPPPAAEVTPPSIDDVRALIGECRTDAMALIVRLAALTGARRGELVALQWDDIRIGDGEMLIRRSLAETDRQLHVGSTKTGRKGHRTVPLDPATIRQLRAHPRIVGCPWLFTHDGRTPWRPPYVTLEFQRTRDRAGVACSFHGLRHFAATQWLASGTPPSQVAGFLGHSTVSTH